MRISVTPGRRTLVFGVIALLFLLLGLGMALYAPTAGIAIYGSFAAAVVAIVAAIAGRNAVDALAGGNGIAGATKVLFTDQKPPGGQP